MNAVTKEKYLMHTKLETARMILAFMCKEKLNQVAELFIKTCSYLQFERDAIEEGYAPFNFAYQSIADILHDYSEINRKLCQLVRQYGCNLSYPRTMSDLEKLEYLLELQAGGNSFLQNNIPQASRETEAQNNASEQTFSISSEVLQQLEQNKGNDAMSFVVLTSNAGEENAGVLEFPSSDKFPQGASVASAESYTMAAPQYANTSMVSAQDTPQGAGGSVTALYYLVDDNANEPVMVEVTPQDSGDIGDAVGSTQPAQSVPSEYSTGCPQISSSLPAPVPESNRDMASQPQSTVDLRSFNTDAMLVVENQYHMEQEVHSRQLPEVLFQHQLPEQQQFSTGNVVTHGLPEISSSLNINHRSYTEQAAQTVPTHAPCKDQSCSPYSKLSVSIISSPNQAKLVSTSKDNRNNLALASEKKAKTENNKEPHSAEMESALEEWRRIRSVDKSNFDNAARQEFNKIEYQMRLDKVAERREKRRIVLSQKRLAAKGKVSVTVSPEKVPVERESTAAKVGQKRQRTQGGRGGAVKRRHRSIDDGASNANDSLHRQAAILEAALITPKKPDELQQARNYNHLSTECETPNEKNTKNTAPSTTLSLTPANSMPFQKVASESETTLAGPLIREDTPVATGTSKNNFVRESPTNDRLSQEPSSTHEQKDDHSATNDPPLIIEKPATHVEATPETSLEIETMVEAGEIIPETPSNLSSSAQQGTSEVSSMAEGSLEDVKTAMAVASIIPGAIPIPRKHLSDMKVAGTTLGDNMTAMTVASVTTISPKTTNIINPGAIPIPRKDLSDMEVAETSLESDMTAMAVASIVTNSPIISPSAIPIARKHLSDMDGSDHSDTSSTDSTSDSDSCSSCSSDSSTSLEEKDENVREMYENSKRYQRYARKQSTRRGGKAVSPSKSPRLALSKFLLLNNYNDNSKKEPTSLKVTANQEQSINICSPSKETGTTSASQSTPRITIITNRRQSKVKAAEQQQKLRQESIGKTRLSAATRRQKALLGLSTVSKQTAAIEKTTVAPTRTKTPRKQKLVPTRADSTFIPPSSSKPALQNAPKATKAPVRNRYAKTVAPTTLPSPTKETASLNDARKDVRRVQTKPAKLTTATVLSVADKQQQENIPFNITPETNTSHSAAVLKPEASVGAIYAVLAQLHGE